MPPKNKGKGKKGKNADDDEFWEKAGEAVPVAPHDPPPPDTKRSFAGFAALDMADNGATPDEEEEDFGGLMSVLKATATNKKDKKKKKKGGDALNGVDDPPADEAIDEAIAVVSKKPLEMTAEDLADEEWGPVKDKGKKSKKGKAKKGKAQGEDEDEAEIPNKVDEPPEDEESKKALQMTADDLADEEWGPAKGGG
ncbi:hypothetical protein GGX14DRAFT_539035 [Mycena pura]|uniref:Uncharacterized protein n=1 Tax=Mycena pura TaxID=153505 RepID=A0AAD6YTU8_9AGAR|nr:hypothetical protein GGX14DRAFT_539035 [Mycena pura]